MAHYESKHDLVEIKVRGLDLKLKNELKEFIRHKVIPKAVYLPDGPDFLDGVYEKAHADTIIEFLRQKEIQYGKPVKELEPASCP